VTDGIYSLSRHPMYAVIMPLLRSVLGAAGVTTAEPKEDDVKQ
jgi:protein-S-isoprenylcysteine O-methyltransferase Ste14